MNRVSSQSPFRVLLMSGIALIAAPALILWAWNIALPEIFGVPTIDYRSALGLMVLGIALGQLAGAPFHARRTGLARRSLHKGTGEAE